MNAHPRSSIVQSILTPPYPLFRSGRLERKGILPYLQRVLTGRFIVPEAGCMFGVPMYCDQYLVCACVLLQDRVLTLSAEVSRGNKTSAIVLDFDVSDALGCNMFCQCDRPTVFVQSVRF